MHISDILTFYFFPQEYCIFWPLEREEITCDQFRVRFTSERQQGPFVIRDFTLLSFTVSDAPSFTN